MPVCRYGLYVHMPVWYTPIYGFNRIPFHIRCGIYGILVLVLPYILHTVQPFIGPKPAMVHSTRPAWAPSRPWSTVPGLPGPLASHGPRYPACLGPTRFQRAFELWPYIGKLPGPPASCVCACVPHDYQAARLHSSMRASVCTA